MLAHCWGVGGHVVRGGAQKFEIDACRCLCVARVVGDVVELDLSFQMRTISSLKSSGLRFSGGVIDFGVQAIKFKEVKRLRWCVFRCKNLRFPVLLWP